MNIKTLIVLFGLTLQLFSGTYQIELQKNVWNLIGVNGFHISAKNAVPLAGWTQIKDTNDSYDNLTWDMVDETTQNTTATPDSGDEVYSTLGIKIERDSNPLLETAIINYDKKTKDRNKSMIAMFVSSQGYGRKGDLQIFFQEDYIGDKFYLTFNNSTTQSYEGVFGSNYTRDNPFSMSKYKVDANDAITKVIRTLDMNLSDNNLSNLDNIDVNNDTLFNDETGGRQQIGADENLSIYSWDGSSWNIYRSGNPAELNDFDSFEAGKAYWTKIDTATNSPTGLILGDGDINSTTYTGDIPISSGWNLLSYDESYIRYISSSIFVNNSDYNGSGFVIRDNYRKSSIIIPAYITSSDYNVSAFINNTAAIGDLNGSFSWKVRAYPGIDKDGNNGIVLISDEPFEVNATSTSYGSMSIAKQELGIPSQPETIAGVTEDQIMYQSRVDEFVVGAKLNSELFENGGLSGKKTSFKFRIPEMLNADLEADLSAETSYSGVLSKVSSKLGSDGQAILIDQTLSGTYDMLVIGSKRKYYLRDSTIVKVYDYNDSVSSTDINLLFSSGSANIVSNGTLQDTVDKINTVSAGTNISAFIVNDSKKRIMLMSNSEKLIHIREKGETEQFSRVELYREFNSSVKGGFTDLAYGIELARAKVQEINTTMLGSGWNITDDKIKNGNTLTGSPYSSVVAKKDLSYTPVWAPDFPIDGPLYKLKDLGGSATRVNYLVSGVTRSDSTIYWRQADSTMDADRWKLEEEKFNLFKMHKDRGYWTYIDSLNAEANPLSIDETSFSRLITRTFNNLFPTSGSNQVSEVENNQIISAEVSVSGFDDKIVYAAPGEQTENVVFNVNGELVPLIKNGATTNYIAELNDYELPSIKEKVYPALKAGLNLIVTDGKGNKKEKIVVFDNVKPEAPEYYYEDNNTDSGQGYFGGLKFVFDDNVTLQIYDGNLSDYTSNSSQLIKDPEEITIPGGFTQVTHHVNPLSDSYITYGTSSKPYYDLRLIVYTINNLWSNMRRVLYAPVYKSTHILEHDENSSSYERDPIAFSSDGQSLSKYTEGGLWTDSGVELNATDGTFNDANITLSMSYQPVVGAKFDAGIPIEVYFDDNTSATGYVGRIRYNNLYTGKVFYIYSHDQNQTYWQTFPAADRTAADPLELIPIDGNQTFYKPEL